MNIVFSTTRQWNPGDEFILRGCIHALRAAGLEFNPVIFNRNPQTRRSGSGDAFWRLLDERLFGKRWTRFLDNSLKDTTDFSCVDLVVFAGSPEWRGRRLEPLYERILGHATPVLFLGLGSNRRFSFTPEHFSPREMRVLREARLITCRDALTAEGLQGLPGLPVHRLSCPALLSATQERARSHVRRVGLIYGSDRSVRHNRVRGATYGQLLRLYRALMARYGARYEFEFIAHYIDELPHFRPDFPGRTLRYSYDSRDYEDLYGACDLVLGHRIHGVAMAASQGVPGLCIAHDLRGDTARGFGAQMLAEDSSEATLFAAFDAAVADLAGRSQALIALKRQILERYRALIAEALPDLLPAAPRRVDLE